MLVGVLIKTVIDFYYFMEKNIYNSVLHKLSRYILLLFHIYSCTNWITIYTHKFLRTQ